MSGIVVKDECVSEWNKMKLKHAYNWITFKVRDEKEIVVDQAGKSPYSEFVAKLLPNQCLYAVVEAPGTTKLVFIMWAPDSAGVKDKMIYASSRQALLGKLAGYSKAIQASDLDDVSESKVKHSL